MKKFLTFLMTAILTLGVFTMSACGGASEKGVFLLSLSDDVMNSFIADNKIDGKYDVYGKVDITNDQYDFIDASSPVKTIGVSATYIVSNDLSEEVVYNITKAMWESKGSIGHSVESTMDTNLALVTIGNVKIHPGAAKYYREIENETFEYVDISENQFIIEKLETIKLIQNFIDLKIEIQALCDYISGSGYDFGAFVFDNFDGLLNPILFLIIKLNGAVINSIILYNIFII